MTSPNGNIFRVTGPLCGEFTGPGEFPTQRPVTRSFDVFFDQRPNKQLSKQPRGWWFEAPSWSLRRQCNVFESPLDATCLGWCLKNIIHAHIYIMTALVVNTIKVIFISQWFPYDAEHGWPQTDLGHHCFRQRRNCANQYTLYTWINADLSGRSIHISTRNAM